MNSYLLLFTGQIECQKSGGLAKLLSFCIEFPSASLASIPPPRPRPHSCNKTWLPGVSVSFDFHRQAQCPGPLVPIQLRYSITAVMIEALSDADPIMVLS